MKTCTSWVLPGLILLAMISLSRSTAAITLHESGYTASAFVALPATYYSPGDIEVDAEGNLYIPTLPDAIRRITPSGVMTDWSLAQATDLTMTSDGYAYGAGRGTCHCILSILPDGSFTTLHSDAYEWTWVDLGPDGKLYANVWAGDGEGLYTVDRTSGNVSLVVAGGPAGITDYYRDMAVGADGELYVIGGTGLYRLFANHFVLVAALPHGGIGLALGPNGQFFTATSWSDLGEVWRIDPSTGTATLFASELDQPSGIAYDPSTDRLYVSEQEGQRIVYAITRVPTGVGAVSWGQLKSLYR